MNKIDMSIGSLSLKTEGTQFLANHVWKMYNSKMRALHEMIRVFLADYHNHRFVNIRYTCKANSETAGCFEEVFTISAGEGRDTVLKIKLSERRAPSEDSKDTPYPDQASQAELIAAYDGLATYSHNGLYDEGSSNITAQTLLYPFRALVNNVLTAAGDARLAGYTETTGNNLHLFMEVRPGDRILNYITFDFYSPSMESTELTEAAAT